MRRPRKLLWKLYPSYLVIILLSLAAVAWYAFSSVRNFYITETQSELEAKARMAGKLLEGKFSIQDASRVDAICKELGKSAKTRITVILASGKVIGDSYHDPSLMENHTDRPEVAKALKGEVGIAIRKSPTEHKNEAYVAVPVFNNGAVIAAVRASVLMTALADALYGLYFRIALAGLIVAALAALVSLVVSHRLNLPLAQLKKGAERFASGQLGYRLRLPESQEINAVAEAMNQMAAMLEERISALTHQRNELEAVLSSMIEAVLVIDREENILRFNQAAGQLLRLNDEHKGRHIGEVVRNNALLKFISETLSRREPLVADILLYKEAEKYLQAHGSILRDGQGNSIGALLVLNDITSLKRLENIRRDFVANVSHELKTPITSIKGFVETLKEAKALDSENAQKFLDIIKSHADRLNAIIEDLLSLSRIEQSEESGQIALQENWLKPVIESAIALNQSQAREKNIRIELDAGDDIKARMNPQLLEQAVSNLIDNAVKFSEPGTEIRIKAEKTDREAVILVEDSGCGIPQEHLDRIFERFYRVDKARSRKLGGTGLGLAIVKHIVQAHRGKVAVESTLGKGSRFYIFLPLQ